MKNESIGNGINVSLREIDRITGLTSVKFTGHNRITKSGLQVLADYISAHFNSGDLLEFTDQEINANASAIINDFKALVKNLPYCVHLGLDGRPESYFDTGIIEPLIDPVTDKPIILKLSSGSSTIQSALIGSLNAASVSGYSDGITVSFAFLSSSTTFDNFRTGANGIIIDEHGDPIALKELALTNLDGNKCWARISLGDDGLILNKNKVYDILWNINLVSVEANLREINE